MFYNKDNPQWQLNQEQYLSSEERDRIVDEYNELCRSMLRTDVRDMNAKFYGVKETGTPEEQEKKRKKALFGIIAAMLIFSSLVLSLILKQLVIFGYVACAVFLFAGISLAVTGKGEVVEATSRALINRVMGICIALGALSILLLIIFRNHMGQAEFFIMLGVVAFGFSGLALIVISILKALSGKILYTQETEATCTGYVRYVSRESGEHQGHTFTFIHTSPLFSYTFRGIPYEAVWDEFTVKADSDISLGQSVTIRIDPRHPENIKSPATTHPGAIGFQIFMAVLCLGVAVGMGIYVSAGAAAGMTVETEWNPIVEKINGGTSDNRTEITDEMMDSDYAKRAGISSAWYYEEGVIDEVKYTADGKSYDFTDKTFNGVLFQDGTDPAPGKVMLLFYTVNESEVQYGTGYKHVFMTGDPDRFVYTGTHTAYIPD